MHVKDLLDYLDVKIKLPQHWYSTDISNDFEGAELIQNDFLLLSAVRRTSYRHGPHTLRRTLYRVKP